MIDVKEDKSAFCGDPKSRASCIEECRGFTEDKLTLFKQPIKKKYIKKYIYAQTEGSHQSGLQDLDRLSETLQ